MKLTTLVGFELMMALGVRRCKWFGNAAASPGVVNFGGFLVDSFIVDDTFGFARLIFSNSTSRAITCLLQ